MQLLISILFFGAGGTLAYKAWQHQSAKKFLVPIGALVCVLGLLSAGNAGLRLYAGSGATGRVLLATTAVSGGVVQAYEISEAACLGDLLEEAGLARALLGQAPPSVLAEHVASRSDTVSLAQAGVQVETCLDGAQRQQGPTAATAEKLRRLALLDISDPLVDEREAECFVQAFEEAGVLGDFADLSSRSVVSAELQAASTAAARACSN